MKPGPVCFNELVSETLRLGVNWLISMARWSRSGAAAAESTRTAPPIACRMSPDATGGSTAFHQLQDVIDESTLPDEEHTGDHQLQKLTSCAMLQIENEFEPRTWQAFWRTVVDGIATDEMAKELSTSPASVRQSRSRILRRLRCQLGDVV